MEKSLPPPTSAPIPQRKSRHALLLPLLLAAVLVSLVAPERFQLSRLIDCRHELRSHHGIKWRKCADGLQCGTIKAPLDHLNISDSRTVELSFVKYPAQSKDRLGSIFFNPGGPGVSATKLVWTDHRSFSEFTDGRYDLIGLDPRGVNTSSDHVSCFESALEQNFYLRSYPMPFDLPVNFSSSASGVHSNPDAVVTHLEAQVRTAEASFAAFYQKCYERTGDVLSYMGTQSLVYDLNFLALALDGPDAKLNYWGFSYGTIVGQYLTSILPKERIGRVIIDGVVNSTLWNKESAYSNRPYASLRDIDLVYESFARSCVAAGDACALSYLGSTSAIFSAIDGLVDSLYHHPAPLPDLPASPGLVARARQARLSLFLGGYSVKLWPAHAERIASALKGDYAPLINASLPRLDSSVGKASHLPDPSGNQATIAIRCADLKTDEPAPSSSQIAHNVLLALQLNSPRLGDQFSDLSFCHLWPAPRKSAYEGDFALAPGALDTPVLVLSQREDPVTPLASAQHAIEKYGTNARLVEQLGTGHCAVGQASLCTVKLTRAYWLDGVIPAENHTICDVEERPFEKFPPSAELSTLSVEDGRLLQLWSSMGRAIHD